MMVQYATINKKKKQFMYYFIETIVQLYVQIQFDNSEEWLVQLLRADNRHMMSRPIAS